MEPSEMSNRLEEVKDSPHPSSDILPERLRTAENAEYLKAFVKPDPELKCIMHETRHIVDWSIAHGETFCVKCGYPSRSYHYLKNADGKEERFTYTLQYHPSGISINK